MSDGLERVAVSIAERHEEVARSVARRIATIVRGKNASGEAAVLGLATGSTPLGVYRELIRMHRDEGLDFSQVVTFNLDEYVPMDPGSLQSYHRFMHENFFDHVNVPPENVHIPRGDLGPDETESHCAAYERAIAEAGGIDFQILGIGRTGHIGFNEPGAGRGSRTRMVFLDSLTRKDAASDFFGEPNVPFRAVTMGIGTILEAREIALIATGEHKAPIVKRAVEGPAHPDVPATYLQDHSNVTFYLDMAAAARLTRIETPWITGEVTWTEALEMRAVLWLSRHTGKSILRLETQDYRDNHLASLVARYGSAPPMNGNAFNALVSKIHGKSKLPQGRRVLVFSPPPDDDVISMGGILRKLVENDNEITVAYQTSGNIAVFDHDVRRYLDMIRRVARTFELDMPGMATLDRTVHESLERKVPGSADTPDVQELKRVIRETEAVSALEAVGIQRDRARFLNLPFYRTGLVRKDPIAQEDVRLTREVVEEVSPDIVFAAGDLSDPHGTHRMCLEAVQQAMETYEGPEPEIWLYRGAWEEWGVDEASVLVPMSSEELRLKIQAIFKHQSQKDTAPFPGPDEREFWQRVEERNIGTARLLEQLGLPAYYAMEAYVVLRNGEPLRNPLVATSTLGR